MIPTKMKIDDLPDFRIAIPTPDDLDTEGCEALLRAVTIRTAEDYYQVCDQPRGLTIKGELGALLSRDAIEYFIRETMPTRGWKMIEAVKELKRQKKTIRDAASEDRAICQKKKITELEENAVPRHKHRCRSGIKTAIKIC